MAPYELHHHHMRSSPDVPQQLPPARISLLSSFEELATRRGRALALSERETSVEFEEKGEESEFPPSDTSTVGGGQAEDVPFWEKPVRRRSPPQARTFEEVSGV